MTDKNKQSLFSGIAAHNPLLVSGMLAAPAAVFCTAVYPALSYAAVFSAVTLAALIIAVFVPRSLAYALRIILYTASAAIVYIPVYNILDGFLPLRISTFGVFAPLIVSSSFIVSASELRFCRMPKRRAFPDILFHIIGYDAAIILIGALRELFGAGGLGGELYGVGLTIPGLSAPYAGLILIGLLAAGLRCILRKHRRSNSSERVKE